MQKIVIVSVIFATMSCVSATTAQENPRDTRVARKEPAADAKSQAEAQHATREAERMDAKVQQQLSSVQQRLKAEELRLQARFEEIAKRREVALKKGDEKVLKQIEQVESSAVKDYEQRVEAILKGAANVGNETGSLRTPQSENKQAAASAKRAVNPLTRNVPDQKPAESQPKSRKNRWSWPFR